MSNQYAKKGYLLEDFRLFHLKDHGEAKVDYHYHEFYKLLFFVSGSGGYFVEGKRYSLAPGDIVLIEGNYLLLDQPGCSLRENHSLHFSGISFKRIHGQLSVSRLFFQRIRPCSATKRNDSTNIVFRCFQHGKRTVF